MITKYVHLLSVFACATFVLAGTAQAQSIAFINEDVLVNSNLTAGADGIPDHLGDIVTTTARVTSIDFRSGFDPNNMDAFDPPFVEIYVQDPGTTEATRLFFAQAFEPGFDSSTLAIGDEFRIEFAEITHVHGVTSLEVLAPSFDLVNTGAGNSPIAPTLASLDALLSTPEDFEGALVLVTNVTITGGNWPTRNGSASLPIDDGTSNSTLRIDSDTNIDGQPAPISVFDLTGIFTQFDTTDPFDSGYQILPRFYTDIAQTGVPPASAPILVLTPDTTLSAAPGQVIEIDLFGIDTNATDTLTFANIAGPGGNLTSQGDREALFSWTAAGEGTTNTFTFTVSDGALSDTQSVDVVVLPQTLSDIILNEFQADPATDITGDANGDGIRDFAQDEFVEIVNRNPGNDQDIGNWVLRIGTNELFTFPGGTILTAETAAVVFGGATIALNSADFGNAQVFIPQPPGPPSASTRWFGISNSGSQGGLTLTADGGTPIFNVVYGGSAAENQSRNLDPDLTGTQYQDHSTLSGSGGTLYSPGRFINGSPFPGSGLTNSAPVFDLQQDYVVRVGQASSATVTASDIDGNPLSITVSNAPASAVLTDLGNGTATLVYTGQVADAGTNFDLQFTVSDGFATDTLNLTLYVPSLTYSGLIINEFLPDPDAGAIHLDTNNDGVENIEQDEFVEIINLTEANLDLTGCILSDAAEVRHTFSSLVIPTNGAVVVFGGGSLTNFTVAPAQTASTGSLVLNNGGDTISLFDPATNLVDRVTYGPDPGVPDAASLNRDPDVTGDTFAIHSTVTGSGGSAASPGTRVNGTSFVTDQPPTIVFSGSTNVQVGETLQVDVLAAEPDGDAVTLVATNLPANGAFVDTNGVGSVSSTFSFTPDITQTGTVVATFIASDIDGATTNTLTLNVTVGQANVWDFESGLQGWTIISQASDRDWTRVTGTGAEGSAAYFTINGFSADVACDDWLISPALDLTGFTSPALTFWVQRGFDGIPNNRQFLVSTDYVGTGDPSLATWDLTTLPDPGSSAWPAPAQSVNLSAYTGSATAYVAFRYQSDGPGTTQHDWEVDQVRLVETQNSPPTLVVPGPQIVSAGDVVTFEVTATEPDGDAITLTQQNKPAAASFVDSGTGTGTFNWVTTLADTGTVTVTFIASDVDGADTNSVDITVLAPPSGDCGLIFSEYIEGSGNNKALELYNGTPNEIDLAAGNYVIARYNNGGLTPSTSPLTGTIASGGTYIVANPGADPAILAVADDATGTATFYNGDDAIELRSGGEAGILLDSIGRVGEDPGSVWGTEPVTTGEHTLRRKSSIASGDTDSSDPYDPAVEWDGFPQNTFDGLGVHLNDCPQTGPVDSDGDGVSDADEAIADTNSSDSNDFFAVRAIIATNGNINVTLPTKTTRNYMIQWTADLADTNSWQDLAPAAAMGSGGDDVFTDTGPTNDALFYRGDVRLP